MDISVDASHDPALRDYASVVQLTTIADNDTARRLLGEWGNPQDAALNAAAPDADPQPWLDEARRLRNMGIRPVTLLDDTYPTAWINHPLAPAVLWVRNELREPHHPRVAVFGGLNSTPAATAPGGGVGAWLGRHGAITTALVDDKAGASALKAARLTSPTRWVVPVMTTGLAAPLPVSRTWPAQGWASFPAESVAAPTSTDDSEDAIHHAAHMMLSRADAVVITSVSAAIDAADTLREARVPVYVLCTPKRWLADLVSNGVATRIYGLQDLPDLRTSRAAPAA